MTTTVLKQATTPVSVTTAPTGTLKYHVTVHYGQDWRRMTAHVRRFSFEVEAEARGCYERALEAGFEAEFQPVLKAR